MKPNKLRSFTGAYSIFCVQLLWDG